MLVVWLMYILTNVKNNPVYPIISDICLHTVTHGVIYTHCWKTFFFNITKEPQYIVLNHLYFTETDSWSY